MHSQRDQATEFENRRELAKIGSQSIVESGHVAPTINAYYNPR